MTSPSPWTGLPQPNQSTFVSSGDLWVYGETIPVGVLSLYRTDGPALNLNTVGGGFASGLDIYTAGISGDVNINVLGPYAPFNYFSNSGSIDDLYGTLNINVSGVMTAVNNGTIVADQGDGSQAININLQNDYKYNPNPVVNFYNFGQITANNYGQGTSSITVNMDHQTTFTNDGLITIQGGGAYINLWGEPTNSPNGIAGGPFLASITNNGRIAAAGGGVAFLTAPVDGTGELDAVSGGKLKFAGPVAASETVAINAAVLEFGAPGSFSNPAMQFLAPIVGETSASTILLDGAVGASFDFSMLSQAGGGLGELKVYDASNTAVADLKFVGHFSDSNFVLSGHPASSPSDSWTAISFIDNPVG